MSRCGGLDNRSDQDKTADTGRGFFRVYRPAVLLDFWPRVRALESPVGGKKAEHTRWTARG